MGSHNHEVVKSHSSVHHCCGDTPDHHHGSLHSHNPTGGSLLTISIIVTLLFVVGETIAGYYGNSLALLSDAGHNFTDALSLGLAAYAIWIAKKPANNNKTFGYHRVAILTALFNAVTLVVISLGIFMEAIELIRNPEHANGVLMFWAAAIAFVMNSAIAAFLMRQAKESLNMKAAFIHMAGDAITSLAVMVAGYVVQKTGWVYADPFVSILIGIFLIYSSWGIIKEATDVLLEGTPRGLDITKLVSAVKSVDNVREVHDVHAWTVSDGMHYLSCHVVVAETQTMVECATLIERVNQLLARDFGIVHATIQTEMVGTCQHDAVFCQPHSEQ